MNETAHLSWLAPFLDDLADAGVRVLNDDRRALAPAALCELPSAEWGRAAMVAAHAGLRWAGLWASDDRGQRRLDACLSRDGGYLILRTVLPAGTVASHAPYYPAAERLERHCRDLWGIEFADHPDPRRWTRHQAWGDDQAPLSDAFPREGLNADETPPDDAYPFLQAEGGGVHEIPVGPVHAGIIEPGHFRFQAAGENVLRLEARLGYAHKGIEKLAVGRDPDALLRLAGRVSGDSTVGHAWAASMAVERAARVVPPPRALHLRALLAERERIANHLGDAGAICNDVGFAFGFYQFMRLKELWLRANGEYFGHRLLMDRLVPGGVRVDLTPQAAETLRAQHGTLRAELREQLPLLADNPSLQDRLRGTGILRQEIAERLGCLGYVGRASGVDRDARRLHRYAPYDQLTVPSAVTTGGDVAARLQVRLDEIITSLDLLDRLIDDLPAGELSAAWQRPAVDAEGLGLVEGWRGEILCYLRFDGDGRIARFFPRDPSWFSWPALEQLIRDNIVPEFPVCNKSVNASYSGHDL